MKSLLQTRTRRIAAAIVSGGLFYFVLGLNPYWLAAWRAPGSPSCCPAATPWRRNLRARTLNRFRILSRFNASFTQSGNLLHGGSVIFGVSTLSISGLD